MRAFTGAVGATAFVVLFGCSPTVSDPYPNGEGAGGAGGDAATTPSALAMRFGDWEIPSFDDGDDPLYDARGLDPDSLVLFVASRALTCREPLVAPGPEGFREDAGSELVLIVPPELDRSGPIDLRDERVYAVTERWLRGSFGGGSAGPGSWGRIELGDRAAPTMRVFVRTGRGDGFADEIDGDYVASWCGAPPPVAAPTPGVAMRGAQLPAGADVEGPVDPTALYVFAGTAEPTCASPVSALDCSRRSRVMLVIPAAGLTPGTLDLADAGAAYATSRDGDASCTAFDMEHGPLTDGTVEILGVDDAVVSLRIYGSYVRETAFDADGVYAAQICP